LFFLLFSPPAKEVMWHGGIESFSSWVFAWHERFVHIYLTISDISLLLFIALDLFVRWGYSGGRAQASVRAVLFWAGDGVGVG
jgi:hypothetical protein